MGEWESLSPAQAYLSIYEALLAVLVHLQCETFFRFFYLDPYNILVHRVRIKDSTHFMWSLL